jgi:hypothetical protein
MSWIQWNLKVNAVSAIKPSNFWLFMADILNYYGNYTKEMHLLNYGWKELRTW